MQDHSAGNKSAIDVLGLVHELFPGPVLVLILFLSPLADATTTSNSSWAWRKSLSLGSILHMSLKINVALQVVHLLSEADGGREPWERLSGCLNIESVARDL
jgi:hypothetical protein